MITSTQRQAISSSVTRHFAFTRLQDQFIARAYQALIPVVSRPLDRPRAGRDQPTTVATFRSKAGGA
jgi:hypothetical protein